MPRNNTKIVVRRVPCSVPRKRRRDPDVRLSFVVDLKTPSPHTTKGVGPDHRCTYFCDLSPLSSITHTHYDMSRYNLDPWVGIPLYTLVLSTSSLSSLPLFLSCPTHVVVGSFHCKVITVFGVFYIPRRGF